VAVDKLNGKTILLVEDNEVQREGMATILRQDGYHVIPVEDGAQALAMLRVVPRFDVIVMDMMLPLMDGWDFLRERKRFPELVTIPVVIVTGLGVASPEWAGSLGVAACFRKPVHVADLLGELRRICGGHADNTNTLPFRHRPLP
jgi:CheY-like chemotaxis protein